MTATGRFGDFELLIELARGGMATVHVARHVGDGGFERLVAIKRVHPHLLKDPEVFAMLSDEARLSALVRHPNVVATNQVIDKDGELLLVQDYVEGVSLSFLAKRAAQRLSEPPGEAARRLPVDVAVRLVVDLLRGLHAAHEAVDLRGEPLRLVHRDVSPQNVLVGGDGAARLIDFGIARAEGRLAETRTGVIKGKLAYMAPEQVAEAEVDRRADVFAAAVVLHELVTGERPFEGAGDVEVMARMLLGSPDLSAVGRAAPALVDPLTRALARDRDERFPTAEAMGEALLAASSPVPDGEVRALLQKLVGDELAARREEIRDAMGRADSAVEPEVEAQLQAQLDAGPAIEADAVSTELAASPDAAPAAGAPRRTGSPWLGVAAIALVAVVAAAGAVSAVPRPPPTPVAARSASTPVSPASSPTDRTPSVASAPTTAPQGTASAAPSGDRVLPAPGRSSSSRASPVPSAPASPRPSTAPSTELHRNPYGH